ncbi:MAG TPA: methyltransferase domain-containing protein [Vicinamibacterales bacterium]|jgi:SAM-dependent methyltransferase
MTGQIRFDDGTLYERFMGQWSRLAGDVFIDWLAAPPGLQWLDVGCGSGAFTELVVNRCAPQSIIGIDPSEGQLSYARQRLESDVVQFRQGDAMAMQFPDATFDIAVMPLVIFFVQDPARSVAEMTRVTRPGGQIAAYAWDMAGGGFPYAVLLAEMRNMGMVVPGPPSPEASKLDRLVELWTAAGLAEIDTREIVVERTFADFDDYWTTILGSPSVGTSLRAMRELDAERLKSALRAHLPADMFGRITCSARANAVKGWR